MILQIKANDTLFFKDGKPFSRGNETWADGIFPPPPSVIYGALRGKYFSENMNEFSKAGNSDDPSKRLKIHSYCIGTNNNLFPLPLDLYREKDDNVNRVHILKKYKNEETINSKLNFDYLLKNPNPEIEIESIDQGYLTFSNLNRYLQNKNAPYTYYHLHDLIRYEPKIGIARNNFTNTSEEGKLYRVNMVRPENESGDILSLFIKISGISIPETGVLKLGAENKTAIYEIYNDPNDEIKFPNIDKYFKVYLATDSFFKNGIFPSWINPDNLKADLDNGKLKLKLETCSIGKFKNIGGYEMKGKNKGPKKMRRAVPAGSVYYFKLLEGSIEDVKNIFHNTSISDYRAKEGFGISYVGAVQ